MGGEWRVSAWSAVVWFMFMVFNTTFNNISVISWRSALLVKETRVPGKNHRPVTSHWQTWSHNVVSSTTGHIQGWYSPFDCTGNCKLNYHTITITSAVSYWRYTMHYLTGFMTIVWWSMNGSYVTSLMTSIIATDSWLRPW
jgi:hypothetical protein